MKIVLIGPQGAGKGTIAQMLAAKLNVPHISTGDMFRDAAAQDTDVGKKVKELIDRGRLIDDNTTTELLKDRLSQSNASGGFILDGYPRNAEQAKRLENITKIDKVLHITAPDEVIIERLRNRVTCAKCHAIFNIVSNPPKEEGKCDKCGARIERRADESEEATRKRLEIYHNQTEPLLKYYKEKRLLSEIDNSLPFNKMDEVVKSCLAAIEVSS